jgi:hypothetical protein
LWTQRPDSASHVNRRNILCSHFWLTSTVQKKKKKKSSDMPFERCHLNQAQTVTLSLLTDPSPALGPNPVRVDVVNQNVHYSESRELVVTVTGTNSTSSCNTEEWSTVSNNKKCVTRDVIISVEVELQNWLWAIRMVVFSCTGKHTYSSEKKCNLNQTCLSTFNFFPLFRLLMQPVVTPRWR